jgi:LPS O-antigen subunit length determinant protein (WzzB/FepE family)
MLKYFAYWLDATATRLNLVQKFEIAINNREALLKHKVFKSFLLYLGSKQQTVSQLKQSKSSQLRKMLKSTFKAWRFQSCYNRKSRALFFQARISHQKATRTRFFVQWVKSALNVVRARV